MKQRSKSFLVFFLILSMVLQTIGTSFVHANGEVKPNVTVTRFNIYKHKHKEGDPPLTKLYSTDQFDLELDWDASSYGNTIKEKDYFEVQLPTEMQFPLSGSATQFDLVNTDGTVVAKGKINAVNGGGGKIVVTFTKSVENLYNVKGTMKLEASFVRSKIKIDSDNTFTISVNGKPITHTIHVDKPGSVEGEDLAKYAYDPDNAEQRVQWVVRINLSKNLNLQHSIVSDELSPAGAKYLDGTIILKEVEFDNTGKVTKVIKEYSQAELNSMIKFNGDKSSFTLNIGSPGKKSFQLRYQTTYPDDKIVNKVILKGDGVNKVYNGGFNSASSSGTGEGNKGKVKIVKVDAIDPNIKLPKAKFEIRVKGTNDLIETMVTGSNGEAISKKTLDPTKKYVLKEVSTPPGYEVESTSENLEFTPDLNKLTEVKVKNKRVLTNVSGEKTWVNDEGHNVRPQQITVQLLADGQEVQGKTQVVTPDNNGHWKYEFKNLPKYRTDKHDEQGNNIPIVYTVKEVQVPEGYTSEVNGMNIKNTYKPKEFTFKFSKTDVAGAELAGATIKLSSDDGRPLINDNGTKVPSVEWVSDGTSKEFKLAPGNYTFEEKAAPEGFTLATTIKFTLKDDGTVTGTTVKVDGSTTIIAMVDDYKYHDVKVSKVDLGGTELAGAKITVKSADGSDLISNNGTRVNSVTWVSTNTPKELKLRAGKYIFHEESAPEGYLKVTDIEFEVDKDGKVKVTKVAQDDKVEVDGGKITITDRKGISIKTEAKVNGQKEAKAKNQLTLTDKVSYKNLIVGKTYTVRLVWMDKETKQPFLAEGNPIKAETTFVADKADGEVELNVTVDSDYFTKETKLVAFEKMFENNVQVAAHEDINDEAQTVVIKENFNPVKVSKVDLGGTELSGAKITVKSADGTNLIKDNDTKVNTITWVSTNTPKELNLLPGKYVFHEESAPEGYLTVTDIEFEVDNDGKVTVTKVAEDDIVKAEGGKITITDRKKPTVETEAKVNDKKEDAPTDKVVLTDVVKYKNLIVGKKYTAKLVWMDKATGEPFKVNGNPVTAEKEFVANEADGQVELSVTLDAKDFKEDTTLVAFEEVYKGDKLVATHKDLEDEGQTVKVKQPKPDLNTEAKVNGEKEVKAKDELTLTDKVSYKNLVIGKEYTVKLVWMDKATGQPFLVEGNQLTAEKTFVADKADGEIELTVKVDSKHFTKDTTLVAFEEMFHNGVKVGAHEDINDEAQSVLIKENFNPVKVSKVDLGGRELPGAKITVKSADGTNLIKDNDTKVNTITWVSAETEKELNLLPGKYIFHEESAPEGYLTVTDIEFEVDKDGNVTVTKVAEDDIVKAEGGKITITDRKIPKVTTEAKVNDKKEDAPTDKVVLTDVVKYSNLIVGKTYTAKLVWMDKATGQPFLVDGKPVTAEKTFVAEQENGEVELSVTVDAKHFEKDTTLVAFEEVYKDNVLVAAHKDINDEDQTVKVRQPEPKLRTEAKVNGKKEAALEKTLTLTDYVYYTNLVIGKEYTVKLVWMDKATGKEILVDGKPLTVEKTFVAEKSDGKIELSTVVEAKYLKQGKLVAFETMYEKGKEIASHRDINDADQTILLKKPILPKTNVSSNLALYANMLIGSGALVALIDSKRRKRSK